MLLTLFNNKKLLYRSLFRTFAVIKQKRLTIMDISERILQVLQQRGLSKKDLADKLNMPAQNINSTILNNPKFSVLERVAEVLDISLPELIGEEKTSSPIVTIVCPKCGEIISVETTIKIK